MTATRGGFGPPGPLCTEGRCAAILGAIAESGTAKRIAERTVEQAFAATVRALDRLGQPINDQAVLAAVHAAVDELAGPDGGMTVVGTDPAVMRIALDLAAYQRMGVQQRAAAVRELAESALRRARAVSGLDDDDE
jgi:hypothetical protein